MPKATTKPQTKVSPKEEMFCRYWVAYKGDQLRACLSVYNVKNKELVLKRLLGGSLTKEEAVDEWYARDSAASLASNTFARPKVKQRINELLESSEFNTGLAMREHYKLLVQDDDYSAKNQALDKFYKLRGMYQADKIDLNTHEELNIPDDLENMSMKDLQKLEMQIAIKMAKEK